MVVVSAVAVVAAGSDEQADTLNAAAAARPAAVMALR
jgi:hypothetical protein